VRGTGAAHQYTREIGDRLTGGLISDQGSSRSFGDIRRNPPRLSQSSGSLPTLAAIRRASSRVSSFAADRRPGSSSK